MAFDDDNDHPSKRAGRKGNAQGGNPDGDLDEDDDEDDDEDEIGSRDGRLLAAMFDKNGLMGRAVRRGEKDFESHGTRTQDAALEASRLVLEDVMRYTRVQFQCPRAVYFPDVWTRAAADEQPALHLLDRVVAVGARSKGGTWTRSIGRRIPGLPHDHTGADAIWLLPEEALFLVERGTIQLWWPGEGRSLDHALQAESLADDDTMLPLSLQAAYALLVGAGPGRVSLARYQTYANLRRTGFYVLRAPILQPQPQPQPPGVPLWRWLLSLRPRPRLLGDGPLVMPGLYRSYGDIYGRLALGGSECNSSSQEEAADPFRIFFHVWKASGSSGDDFAKARPRPADFCFAVVDVAQTATIPTLQQTEALLRSRPVLTPPPPPQLRAKQGSGTGGVGGMFRRLRLGQGAVGIAVVDRGLVSYLMLADGGFDDEKPWQQQQQQQQRMGTAKQGRSPRQGTAAAARK